MLAPNELKKKQFTKAMLGYNPAEVDEHIAYIVKNYVELYKYSIELQKNLDAVNARNYELSRDSAEIRTALLDAQRAASKIVGEAKQEAEVIIHSSKRSCDNILNAFRAHIAEEREKLMALQNEMSAFKERIYNELQAELEAVEEMTEQADWSDLDIDDEVYTRRIITDIKSDVASFVNERAHAEEVSGENGPDPEIFDAAIEEEKSTAAGAPVSFEVPDEPSDAPDATKIFSAAPMDEVIPEIIPTPVATIEVPRIEEIEEIDMTVEAAEENPVDKAADNTSDLENISTAEEEYDLVLEKFAEELAAEASAENKENE